MDNVTNTKYLFVCTYSPTLSRLTTGYVIEIKREERER